MLSYLLSILGLTVLTALWMVFQLWLKNRTRNGTSVASDAVAAAKKAQRIRKGIGQSRPWQGLSRYSRNVNIV